MLVRGVPVFSLTCSSSDLSQFLACDHGMQTFAVLLFKGNGQTTEEAPCVKAALRGHCTDNDDDGDDDGDDYCDDDDDGKECTAAMRYEGRDDPAKIGCEE